MKKITINDLIETLNGLPEEQRDFSVNAIGSCSKNGKRFYILHAGNTVNPIYIDIPAEKENQ